MTDEHTFTYPDYGTPASLPEHVSHSGQTCSVVRELGDDERDPEVGPMYVVRFADGLDLMVYREELTPEPASTLLVLTDNDDPHWVSL